MNDEGFRGFIRARRWRFAKTMAAIPHEYTVSEWHPDRAMFEEAAQFIRDEGYAKKFFSKTYMYYDVDEHQYWTMGSPIPETILINRALNG